MSNKKLFWVAFFILSCCEFGQVAYSKNMSTSTIEFKPSVTMLQCHDEKASGGFQELDTRLASHVLPR